MSVTSLVEPLFDGPLDIVGDVHGEIDALRSLIRHLRYSEEGLHPDGRRLVFIGDLTDRGPDSPAVVTLVERLISTGVAQCVLGNHDLNILLRHEKYDNDWFFGRPFRHENRIVPQALADERTRERTVDFFKTLPLALERPGLRIVHACWKPEMVDVARQSSNVEELHDTYRKLIEADNQRRQTGDKTDHDLQHQNRNPIKVLTSGLEERIDPPQWSGGKWRHLARVSWWETYDDPELCVFGHYSLRPETSNGHCHAICVDFGVGIARWFCGENYYDRQNGAMRSNPEILDRFFQANGIDLCRGLIFDQAPGAFLLETVPSVIYILMKHGDDLEEAIVRAVNDTKDNDTIAAIVGTAVGALHGKKAIPERWIKNLSGRTTDKDDGKMFELLTAAKQRWGSPVEEGDHSQIP